MGEFLLVGIVRRAVKLPEWLSRHWRLLSGGPTDHAAGKAMNRDDGNACKKER
jgi:hypothetical protein